MKYLLVAILVLTQIHSYCQKKFTIVCDLKNSNKKILYLTNSWAGRQVKSVQIIIDTGITKNNKVIFSGSFDDYKYYNISSDGASGFLPFIIDTGNIYVDINDKQIDQSVITNSIQNDLMVIGRKKIDSFFAVREALQDTMLFYENNKNPDSTLIFSRLMDSIDRNSFLFLFNFAKKNPDSYFILYTMHNINFYTFTTETKRLAKEIFPLLSKTIRESKEGKLFSFLLYDFDKNDLINKDAHDMKLKNINGKSEDLKFSSGKILLIDYWASWCGPCIEKFPILRKINEQYKAKDFEIISISLDADLLKWKTAVFKYKLPWKNYCDINGLNSEYVKKYGITEIPFTILIGPDKKIVSINPSLSEVEKYIRHQK